MSSPRILITGGTGFAGSHLIEHLQQAGYHDIWSTSYRTPEGSARLLPQDRYIQVDLTDAQATASLVQTINPEWIFHLASFAYVGKSFEKARELLANNTNLQLSILDAVRHHAPQARVLTIGSAEEYGYVDPAIEHIREDHPFNPINPYGVSKVTQDLLAQSYVLSYGLSIIRTRSFNHIGTRQTGDFAIPAFVQQIVAIEQGNQDALLVGNLAGIRDFTSVHDMVDAYILLMEKGTPGEVYNIGSGVPRTMEEVVSMLGSLATVPVTVKVDPTRFRPLDVPKLVADNRKIRDLGWEPKIALETELVQVLQEWRENEKGS